MRRQGKDNNAAGRKTGRKDSLILGWFDYIFHPNFVATKSPVSKPKPGPLLFLKPPRTHKITFCPPVKAGHFSCPASSHGRFSQPCTHFQPLFSTRKFPVPGNQPRKGIFTHRLLHRLPHRTIRLLQQLINPAANFARGRGVRVQPNQVL